MHVDVSSGSGGPNDVFFSLPETIKWYPHRRPRRSAVVGCFARLCSVKGQHHHQFCLENHHIAFYRYSKLGRHRGTRSQNAANVETCSQRGCCSWNRPTCCWDVLAGIHLVPSIGSRNREWPDSAVRIDFHWVFQLRWVVRLASILIAHPSSHSR
jgi:hypothetical protein